MQCNAHVDALSASETTWAFCMGRVIGALMKFAEEAGCYKVILDCGESNVAFYEKCGLTRKEVQMVSCP